jgi:hypothetical protein
MPTFSDQLLVDILKKAARRINRKLNLTGTALEITIDDSGLMATPDPADNQDLYDMVLLQAECLITQREYQTELRDADGGVMIRDGEQTVDTRGTGVARGTFFNSDYSPCAELKEAVLEMKLNGPGGLGTGKLVW